MKALACLNELKVKYVFGYFFVWHFFVWLKIILTIDKLNYQTYYIH